MNTHDYHEKCVEISCSELVSKSEEIHWKLTWLPILEMRLTTSKRLQIIPTNNIAYTLKLK